MSNRPNILFIFTDQQHAGMLSCAGNQNVSTPNLDKLAAQGIRFERAYCANSVCMPSRFSMMTGAYPSRIGMESHADEDNPVPREVLEHAMGNLLRGAGYQTVYGGKIHLPGPDDTKGDVRPYGFDLLTPDDREGLATACADFIRGSHEQPFLLVASFINPHDICYMALNDHLIKSGNNPIDGCEWQCLQEALRLPDGMDEEEFMASCCPELPANFEVPEKELTAFMRGKPEFMSYARREWTEREWRLHRWAYARLTERVDSEIGIVLDALRDSGLEKNTLVIFTSDHGDQDGAHRVEHKAFLYEESVNVPLIVSWKGVIQQGGIDHTHLISTGLDLLPTICDAANIEAPQVLEGKSLLALIAGNTSDGWRDHLLVENYLARLVHMGRWKYMVGQKPDTETNLPEIQEMLIDLENDPGEMDNRVDDPASMQELAKGREILKAKKDSACYIAYPDYIVGVR